MVPIPREYGEPSGGGGGGRLIDLTMDSRCDDWDNNVRDSLGIQFCMHLFDTCLCLVTLHVNF